MTFPSLSLLACPSPHGQYTLVSTNTVCDLHVRPSFRPGRLWESFFPRKTSRAGAKGGTSLFLTHHFPCSLSPSWGQSRCIVSGRGALDPSPSSTHGVPQTLVRGFVELPSASRLHPFWVGFDCPYIWTRGAQHDLCQGRCVADMDGLMGCLLPTCDPHHCEMHSSPFQMSQDPEGVRDLSKVTKQKMAE